MKTCRLVVLVWALLLFGTVSPAAAQSLSIQSLKAELSSARTTLSNVHTTYGSQPLDAKSDTEPKPIAEVWQAEGAYKCRADVGGQRRLYFEDQTQKAELYQDTNQGTIFGKFVPHPYVPLLAGYSFDGQPFDKWLDRATNVTALSKSNEILVKAELKGHRFTFTLDRRYGTQITNLRVEKDSVLLQEDQILAFQAYKGGFIPSHIVRHIQSADVSRMPMGAMEFYLHDVKPATKADVTVKWPEGAIVKDVPANKLFRVVDGKLKLDHVLRNTVDYRRMLFALGIVFSTAIAAFLAGQQLTQWLKTRTAKTA